MHHANKGSLRRRLCGRRRTLCITCTALLASCAADSWPLGTSFTSWRMGGWCARWIMRLQNKTVGLHASEILSINWYSNPINSKEKYRLKPYLKRFVICFPPYSQAQSLWLSVEWLWLDLTTSESQNRMWQIKLCTLCNAVKWILTVDLCCLSSGCGCCLSPSLSSEIFMHLWLIM